MATHYAGEGRWRGALLSSTLLILTHVGSTILIVLTGAVIIQRTLLGAGRTPILERSSQVLIVLVVLWLLWRAFRPHHHAHARSGPALASVGGLILCPLIPFIMAYAVANGLVAAGLVVSAAFASSMILAVVAFPLATVLIRNRRISLGASIGGLRRRIGFGLELLAALPSSGWEHGHCFTEAFVGSAVFS